LYLLAFVLKLCVVIQGISYAKLANLPAIHGLCECVDFGCSVGYVYFSWEM